MYSLVQGLYLNHWGGSIEFKIPDSQRTPNPGVLITENLHEGKHLYTKLDITHLLTVSTAGHFTQKTSKTKTQSNHQQTGVPQTLQNIPPQIAPPIKKKKTKNKKKKPLLTRTQAQEPVERSQPKLRKPFHPKAKTKTKKEYNPKALEKENSYRVR